jgi:hypothetical protein
MKLAELEQALQGITEYKVLNFHFGKIDQPSKFIETHLNFLRSNPKNRRYLPYYTRLLEFYNSNK